MLAEARMGTPRGRGGARPGPRTAPASFDKYVGRTKHIDDTLDPEWEVKTSTFEIPLLDEDGDELNPPIGESTMKVEVFDHDMIGSDDSLGFLTLEGHDLEVLEQKSRPSELELLRARSC